VRECSLREQAFKIEKRLLPEAKRLGKHKSDQKAVAVALESYIRRLKQTRILDLFGTLDFDPAYDYKEERRKKRNSRRRLATQF